MAREIHTQTHGPRTTEVSASSGSQTILQTNSSDTPSATLRLRATQDTNARRIQWAEDVVDNEGMGKKSSKVCCIYHKPQGEDDCDSEDSSSSSDSDDAPDLSRAQRGSGKGSGRHKSRASGEDKSKRKERKPSPNAYERQPKHMHSQGG